MRVAGVSILRPVGACFRKFPEASFEAWQVSRFLQHDGCPVGLHWHYGRTEILTDGFVHIVGLGLALTGAVALLGVTYHSSEWFEMAAVVVYALGLLAMLSFSAAYNMWPISPRKWLLRRFDHSAIFLFIAATYTPLIAQMDAGTTSIALLIGTWLVAGFGITLKWFWPGRFDRLSIALCLCLGGSGFFAYESVVAAFSAPTLWLIAIGGALYTIGVVFHLWEKLRFQNAIWHSFVLAAAGCHYAAIIICVN
jgi:hemolysin III